jgi:hypothetical protein
MVGDEPERRGESGPESPARELLRDDFEREARPGHVIGTRTSSGRRRLGVDRERVLSVDHGSLRIGWLRVPGWRRAGVAYGPFKSVPGLALAVTLSDGLTTSQTPPQPEGRRERLRRWIGEFPRLRARRPVIKEHLAVGWFDQARPRKPPNSGRGFVFSAGGRETGELRLAADGPRLPVLRDLQNVPMTLVAVLHGDRTAFFVSSLPGVRGCAPYPTMRPIGVLSSSGDEQSLFAGIHQSVLGEVKYRVDTRVEQVTVARVPELVEWCTTASVADRLTGVGPVNDMGGRRASVSGTLTRTSGGLVMTSDAGGVRVDAGSPAGLVRALARLRGAGSCSLRFRGSPSGCWRFVAGTDGVRLDAPGGIVARADSPGLTPGAEHALQVVDDGRTISCYVDDVLCFDNWYSSEEGASGAEVGLELRGRRALVADFEAHPRAVSIPPLIDPGGNWGPVCTNTLLKSRFEGPPGDLAGTDAGGGEPSWEHTLGSGVIERDPEGARVQADREHPNPGRTLYTTEWKGGDLVDVEAEIVPPGTARGQGHRARAGLVLWQDADNYLAVNNFLDDGSTGVSISAFLRTGGHEEMYDHDATWSNVGDRIMPGEPYRLRLQTDGTRFLAFVDDETVLVRSFVDYRVSATPLRVSRVGLLVNWEWGDDTGSLFRRLTLRSGSSPAREQLLI